MLLIASAEICKACQEKLVEAQNVLLVCAIVIL